MNYQKGPPFEFNLDRLTLEEKTSRYETIT